MLVNQVATWTNAALESALGRTGILTQDLSNVIDAGRELFAAGDGAVDNFVRALPDHIGKVIFVDRAYSGVVPSILRDAWEFGSICEKIRVEIPEAEDNPAWQLVDGQSYNQDKFYQPKAHVKFWNDRVSFMIPISITEDQVKSAFSGANQLAAFVAYIRTQVEKGMTIRMNALIRSTINNFIGETIFQDYQGGSLSAASHTRAVNLLYLYNTLKSTSLTADQALADGDFLRFASLQIKKYISRLRDVNELLNIGGTEKFTPADMQHVVMLNDFEAAAAVYLYDGKGQFLVDNIKLPYADTVNYWQGTGTDYSFTSCSSIDVETSEGNSVQASGILAVIFDHDALGVTNLDRKTKVHRNEIAEFQNTWEKMTAGFWNDFDEQFVVFFVA